MLPPQALEGIKKEKVDFFSFFFYKYFFRTCTQTGVIIPKNDLNIKGFSGHTEKPPPLIWDMSPKKSSF